MINQESIEENNLYNELVNVLKMMNVLFQKMDNCLEIQCMKQL